MRYIALTRFTTASWRTARSNATISGSRCSSDNNLHVLLAGVLTELSPIYSYECMAHGDLATPAPWSVRPKHMIDRGISQGQPAPQPMDHVPDGALSFFSTLCLGLRRSCGMLGRHSLMATRASSTLYPNRPRRTPDHRTT